MNPSLAAVTSVPTNRPQVRTSFPKKYFQQSNIYIYLPLAYIQYSPLPLIYSQLPPQTSRSRVTRIRVTPGQQKRSTSNIRCKAWTRTAKSICSGNWRNRRPLTCVSNIKSSQRHLRHQKKLCQDHYDLLITSKLRDSTKLRVWFFC